MSPASVNPAINRQRQREEILRRLAKMGMMVDSIRDVSDVALNEIARVVSALADRAAQAGNPVSLTAKERQDVAGKFFDRFRDQLEGGLGGMPRDKFLNAALLQPESRIHAMKEVLDRGQR